MGSKKLRHRSQPVGDAVVVGIRVMKGAERVEISQDQAELQAGEVWSECSIYGRTNLVQ